MISTGKDFLLVTAAVLFLVAAEGNIAKVYVAHIDGGVQRVELAGGNFYFRPSVISVMVNVPVELVVWQEQGFVPHDLVLQSPEGGFNIEEELTVEPRTIRFTPRRAGTYPFYCRGGTIESHREKGMQGVLVVNPRPSAKGPAP